MNEAFGVPKDSKLQFAMLRGWSTTIVGRPFRRPAEQKPSIQDEAATFVNTGLPGGLLYLAGVYVVYQKNMLRQRYTALGLRDGDENSSQSDEEIVLAALDGTADERLTGLALRLVLSDHVGLKGSGWKH